MAQGDTNPRAQHWEQRLLTAVLGMLVFETLTGLAIYLLPFSVPNQIAVLLHTGIGLVFVVPLLWYLVKHWRTYRARQLTHVKLTGYFALYASLAIIVSGVVLSYQALFADRISYAWDLTHVIATFALMAALLPHLVSLAWFASKGQGIGATELRTAQRRQFGRTGWTAVSLIALVAIGTAAYRPIKLQTELPGDYSYVFGPDRPFAPSLARTTTGQAFDPRAMGGSKGCGTSGCHEQIYKEWSVSAHRYAAMDVGFRKIQNTMGEQNGAESTRYCAGCHDPISLFAGTKNLYRDELTNPIGHDEGISCVSCHAIQETDVKGNASYVISQPPRYLGELSDKASAVSTSHFLIRAYPRAHVKSLQQTLYKTAEYCAACHKQYIDEDINRVGWVQLQNQFDNWRKSRWNDTTDATKTIECRECHMPLQASTDPARGDATDYNRTTGDKKHRSHRFLGANQFMPTVLKLEGAAEHVALTNKWLQGKIDIPEIANKWREGPAVPITLVAPPTVAANGKVDLQVIITNNKVGHDYPTGPLDMIQSWVELVVHDQDGNIVFQTGQVDERNFIAPGSFMFKAEPVDQYGALIDRHNLWDMVGVRFRRSLFPGQSDRADFSFHYPTNALHGGAGANDQPDQQRFSFRAPSTVNRLDVSAQLMYRKTDQFLLNYMFGEEAGITAPVTVLSNDTKSIEVTAPVSRTKPQ